jgi:phosphoadenosine phosphosulfate reductase
MSGDEITIRPESATTIDYARANRRLLDASAPGVIAWAYEAFGDSLYALSSAGVDSAVMLDHVARTGRKIPVIFINTGFMPPETLAFKQVLQATFELDFFEYGPSRDDIALVHTGMLWERDPDLYSHITKLEPLSRAIRELGANALLTAVRGDQTSNRAKLGHVGQGNDNEVRIRPFIGWPKSQVAQYISENQLPRHPLYYQGFDSVGDVHTTRAGRDREGRSITECGMHVSGGKVVRGSAV